MGPFFLSDLLGLDTVLHVAEHLQVSYGDRFYVSPGDEGAGRGGQPRAEDRQGLLRPRRLRWRQATRRDRRVVERFTLKAFVEACLVLEEGVAPAKDIELGMMTGAGILPGPFARADEAGLDEMLERARAGRARVGRGLRPARDPAAARRQGRLGRKTGQGFFPYPQPDAGFEQKETVLLETRGEVAIIWLNRPPANPISPAGDPGVRRALETTTSARRDPLGRDRLVDIFTVFSAGADIKEFTKMDALRRPAGLLDSGHAMLREMEKSSNARSPP